MVNDAVDRVVITRVPLGGFVMLAACFGLSGGLVATIVALIVSAFGGLDLKLTLLSCISPVYFAVIFTVIAFPAYLPFRLLSRVLRRYKMPVDCIMAIPSRDDSSVEAVESVHSHAANGAAAPTRVVVTRVPLGGFVLFAACFGLSAGLVVGIVCLVASPFGVFDFELPDQWWGLNVSGMRAGVLIFCLCPLYYAVVFAVVAFPAYLPFRLLSRVLRLYKMPADCILSVASRDDGNVADCPQSSHQTGRS